MKEVKGMVFVIISAVIFGCMPLAAKVLYGEGCNPVSLVVYRYSMSLPILLALALREQLLALPGNRLGRKFLLPFRKGGKSEDAKHPAVYEMTQDERKTRKRKRQIRLMAVKRAMRLNAIQLRQFFILSLGFCATPLLLFSSYSYISSGSATTIHFSYPVFVILAAVLIFKEKATLMKKAAVVFCILGLVCFYEPGQEGGLAGILLALVSGMTYSFYMIFFDRSILKFIRPFKTNFYLSLISAILAFLFALVTGSFVLLSSARGWLMAVAFSFMLTVVASVLFQIGIAAVGAQKSAVLSTFEPITSVILGAVLFHEAVGIKTALGVVFILASVLSITYFDEKRKQKGIQKEEGR